MKSDFEKFLDMSLEDQKRVLQEQEKRSRKNYVRCIDCRYFVEDLGGDDNFCSLGQKEVEDSGKSFFYIPNVPWCTEKVVRSEYCISFRQSRCWRYCKNFNKK